MLTRPMSVTTTHLNRELWKAALKSLLRNQIMAKQLRKELVNARVVLDLNDANVQAMRDLLPEIQDDGIVTEKMTVEDAKATLAERLE